MAKVFVSHAKEDAAAARRIAAFLEAEEIRCWIAPRDVPPGEDYGAAILKGIEECDALLLVLSERSNESHFVHREVERAVSKAKPVLPVRIREIAPSGSLEFFISSAQWIDAWRPPMEQHLAQLALAIRALSSVDATPGQAATPPHRPRPAGWRPLILVGLLLLALAGGLVAWAPWHDGAPGGEIAAGAVTADGTGPAAPAALPDATAFLAGTWCQPLSGDALVYYRFLPLDTARVSGEVSFSHSSDIDRFDAAATWEGELLTLAWLSPAELVGTPPLRLRRDGEQRMLVVYEDLKSGVLPPNPLTRCTF